MSEPARASEDPKHIPALDGVRGLAILLVLFAHFGDIFLNGSTLDSAIHSVFQRGGIGVDLFFVLSGFLITGILLDSVKSPSYFSTFYIRRALRIFPLYYFFLFAIFAIRRPLMIWWWNYDSMPGGDLRWHLLYVSNWKPDRGLFPDEATHLWSLAIEEQFYLVWPMVVFLVPRRWLGWVCLAGIASAMGLREVLILRHSWWEMLHRWTPVRMDTLLMGALMALAFRNARWRSILTRAVVPIGLIVAAWFVVREWRWVRIGSSSILETLHWSTPAVAFACLVFWAATSGRGSRFLTSWTMVTLGRYSYGLYIWHLLARRLLPYELSQGSSLVIKVAHLLVLILLSCGCAWISWNCLEQPFLRLKDRFSYRPDRAREPAIGELKPVGEPG